MPLKSRTMLHLAGCGLLLANGLHAQARNPVAADADRLFRAGSAAFAAGRVAEAETDFRRLVHLVPGVATAHTALAAVLMARGDAPGALEELSKAHRLAPAESRTALDLAAALHAVGRNAEAASVYADAVRAGATLSPEEAFAYATALRASGALVEAQQQLETAVSGPAPQAAMLDALGAVLAQQSKFSDAEQRLEQALTVDPAFAPAHAHLGSVLLATHQPVLAANEFQKAMDLGDTSPVTASQAGRALVQVGRDAEAVALLRPVAARLPDDVSVGYVLALALQAGGYAADSLPLFQRAVEAMPANAEALTNYGLALEQNGKAAEGLQAYRRALAAGGDSPLLRQNMGVAYLQGNDVEHAMEQFRLGLAAAPDDVQLHYNLGLALKLHDDVPGAIMELQHAATLDPQLPDPHYTLGVLKMQGGDFAEASAQLERVVTLQPQNGEAWALLGSVFRQAGDSGRAATALQHAIALQPAQPGPHVMLASIFAEGGDRERAAAERKIAAELSRNAVNEQRGQFALRSGRALLLQGKLAEAVAQLQTAVSATPDSVEAHRTLADALQRTGRSTEAAAESSKAATLTAAQR